jgi:hypothetical protein
MESNSTAILIKIKLRHSLGRPSRSDFVQTELLDEYIGEYAYNKYLKNNINEKQDVKRYLLYALVLSRIYGTQRVYKTILQFFKKINEED